MEIIQLTVKETIKGYVKSKAGNEMFLDIKKGDVYLQHHRISAFFRNTTGLNSDSVFAPSFDEFGGLKKYFEIKTNE